MHRTFGRAFMLCAAAVAFTACGDSPESSVTAPMVTRPNLSSHGLNYPTVCDINALKTHARNYAVSNRDDLVAITIPALQAAVRDGIVANINTAAFNGLAELAEMRGTSRQKTGTGVKTAFDGLAKGFIACLDAATKAGAEEIDFGKALGAGWSFEVRGGTGDLTGGVYERGSGNPYWAAEAPGGWIAVAGGTRFFIYGYELPTYTPPFGDPKVEHSFETKTIPSVASGLLSFDPALLIGLCNVSATSQAVLDKYRVTHVNDILKKQTLACTGPADFTAASTTASLGAFSPTLLAQRVVNYFAPQPLYAAVQFAAFGPVGGAVSELSPSVVINIDAATSQFVYEVPGSDPKVFAPQTIADGQVSLALAGTDGGPVKVRVTTPGGGVLSGGTVTLAIAGNNSTIAFFNDNGVQVTTVTKPTDENGIASFAGVRLTKAGGYTLTATASFDGIGGNPVLSNPFTIQNK